MSTEIDTARAAALLDEAPLKDATLFRFATAGSVDDGKSTLVGRLLHDSKAILADQLDAVARTSADRGFGGSAGGIDLALLTDGLRAEREQGITIDVAYRYFATDRRSFILADCPGHVQYTKNTVTGASTADAVVVLIDARKGVLEQTRRHLSVLQLLRVAHVIVAVNKIDLVDFSESVFREIEADVQKVGRELGLGADGITDLLVVPVSALDGDNVVERSERTPGTRARHCSKSSKPFRPQTNSKATWRASASRCSWSSGRRARWLPTPWPPAWMRRPTVTTARTPARSPKAPSRWGTRSPY
jgi:sulfate adenylyltransferase subunit 1